MIKKAMARERILTNAGKDVVARKRTVTPDLEAATRGVKPGKTNNIPLHALKLNRRDFLKASAAGLATDILPLPGNGAG